MTPQVPPDQPPAVVFAGVTVWDWNPASGGRIPIVEDVSWCVHAGQHWAVLGPNGAGKSTLLDIAATARHPSSGAVHILGRRLGAVDVRELRMHIGHVDVRTEESFAPRRTALEVTLSGCTGSIAVLQDRLGPQDRRRAHELLRLVGCSAVEGRPFGRCSQGERRRVLLARALMSRPRLLLLDEPADGLDLPGREALLTALERLAAEVPDAASVLVTHHLEELPSCVTHALLLRRGRVAAAGPAADVLADAPLSLCFDTAVSVQRRDGRWTARCRPRW